MLHIYAPTYPTSLFWVPAHAYRTCWAWAGPCLGRKLQAPPDSIFRANPVAEGGGGRVVRSFGGFSRGASFPVGWISLCFDFLFHLYTVYGARTHECQGHKTCVVLVCTARGQFFMLVSTLLWEQEFDPFRKRRSLSQTVTSTRLAYRQPSRRRGGLCTRWDFPFCFRRFFSAKLVLKSGAAVHDRNSHQTLSSGKETSLIGSETKAFIGQMTEVYLWIKGFLSRGSTDMMKV